MSLSGNSPRRQRDTEPTELLRAERQATQRCIDCETPSKTQRCNDCRNRVEAATNRYRGVGHRGGVPRVVTDLTDLRYAVQDLSKAYAELEVLRDRGTLPRRDREMALADPLARLKLTIRWIQGVIERNE